MEEEISEEIVFKTYNDNKLINFEVTLVKENKCFVLISGLPNDGEIKDIETDTYKSKEYTLNEIENRNFDLDL
jgi:hypothetical protein